MSKLRDILQTYVSNGSVPGAVGLIARGDRVEVEAAGSADVDGTSPMARDSIFRVASITKPIIAAAVMMLVEDGRIALEDPVGPWLPELASPSRRPHRPARWTMWSRPSGRSPWPICSPSGPGTASRPTSRSRRSGCCSAS